MESKVVKEIDGRNLLPYYMFESWSETRQTWMSHVSSSSRNLKEVTQLAEEWAFKYRVLVRVSKFTP